MIVDVSTSMAARDEEGVRLERARAVARSLARDLPEGGAMMVIAAAREPEVLSAPTSDRVQLESALKRLRVRGPGADLEAAVAIAAERLRDAPAGSRVLVLTDAAMAGNIPLEARVPVEVQRLGALPFGEVAPANFAANFAIVALDVRPHPEPDSPDRADIFLRVARYGEGEGEVRLTASIEGGALLASRRVTLSDGEPLGVVMSADLPPDAAARGAFVKVELEPTDGADPLALDDVAVAPSPAARRLPVFLVGPAPASVQRVLRSDSEVELYATDLGALTERLRETPDAASLDGLFVYAGSTPDAPPPGDALVVAPSGAEVFGVPLGAPAERPGIISWEEGDPRMRFVRFTDVHLGRIRPIEGPSARSLLTTDRGSAIGLLERPDSEITILAFDPDDGDWSSQPGFVVFFRNLLERARARRAAGGVAPGELGAPLRIPAPDGVRVTVTAPNGERIVGTSRGGVAVVDVPAVPGVFRTEASGRERFALRDLTDPEESDLRARATFTRRDGTTAVSTVEPVEHREAWPWLALALLAILLLEVLWSTRKGAAA